MRNDRDEKKRPVGSVQKKPKLNEDGKLSLLVSRHELSRRLLTLLLRVLNSKRKRRNVRGRRKKILLLRAVHMRRQSESTGLLRNGDGKKNWTVSLPVVSRRMRRRWNASGRRSADGRWKRQTEKWLGSWIWSWILGRGIRPHHRSYLLAEERVVLVLLEVGRWNGIQMFYS
jgi:hypothetical protein